MGTEYGGVVYGVQSAEEENNGDARDYMLEINVLEGKNVIRPWHCLSLTHSKDMYPLEGPEHCLHVCTTTTTLWERTCTISSMGCR